MVDLLVFSKDRACQAHLLLESIARYCPIDLFNISVLYASSDEEYDKGYELLRDRFRGIEFIRQGDFKADVQSWVAASQNLAVAFAVDDDVFYRDIREECNSLYKVDMRNGNTVFSFRLGFNTIDKLPEVITPAHSTPLSKMFARGRYQPPLHKYSFAEPFIMWNPTDYNRFHNYGYPMSVDMHVFNTAFMLACVKSIDFKNPTSLECGLIPYDTHINLMISFEKSAVTNIPCNNVGGFTEVGTQAIGSKELNDKYLSGKVLDLSALSAYDIVGCHQDIPLTFKDFENG